MPSEWDVVAQKPTGSSDGWDVVEERGVVPGTEKLGPLPGIKPPKPPMEFNREGRPNAQPVFPIGLGALGTVGNPRPPKEVEDRAKDAVLEYTPVRGVPQAIEGVKEAYNAPTMRGKAAGARKALGGAGKTLAPLAIPAAAAAPVVTAVGVASGMAVQAGTEKALTAAGVPEEYAGLAGDVAGFIPPGAAARRVVRGIRYKPTAEPPAPKVEPEIPSPTPIESIPDAGPVPKGPKSAAESAQVFANDPMPNPPVVKSAEESARVFRRADETKALKQAKKIEVPETGIPENVARTQSAREEIARQTTGKPWDQLSNSERITVDELINEGNVGAPQLPSPKPLEPQPVSPRRRASQRGSISPRPNQPLSPTEQYALDMVKAREVARKEGSGVSSVVAKADAFFADLKKKFVTGTAPITDTLKKSQQQAGYEIRPTENIQYYMDRARRAPSIAQQFVKDHGFDRIIRDVENLDYLDQYLIAKQARHIDADKATGRNEAMDAALIRDFDNRIAINRPREQGGPLTYRQVADQVHQYSRDVLDYATEAGLISKDLNVHLKQRYPEYVPLKRVFAEIEKGDGGPSHSPAPASLGTQTVVQKFKGSEREIENPLESLLDKTIDAFSQGERNKAARTLAGYRELPVFQALIHEVPSATGKHTFSYRDNGTKRYFETTPEIASAANAMDAQTIGMIGRILAAPVRMFKVGTTGINLPFVASNVASDLVFTAITARHFRSVAHPNNFLQAFFAAVKHNDLYDEMIRNGSGFTSFDMARGQARKTVEGIRAGRSLEARAQYTARHPIRSVGELFRAAEDIVSRSEEFGRARLYHGEKTSRLNEGRTQQDAEILATVEANNALPNYYEFGDYMRPLNAVVPYINAGVQGTRSFLGSAERAYRGGPADQARFAAKVATTLYMPTAILTMWNLSDEKRAAAYRDVREYEKENNFIWIPPNPKKDARGQWEVLKIKISPGINNLTIPVRRGIEAAHGMDPVKFLELVRATVGTVSPIDPDPRKALSTVIPQAIKPTAQAAANYDFFRGAPKVPPHLQDKPAAAQTLPYTSGTAKLIGGKIGTSPIKTEEFIKDTVGGIGNQLLHASDRVLGNAGVISKEDVRGGQSTMDAITARFSRARGGETDSREFDKISESRMSAGMDTDKMEKQAAEVLSVLKATPEAQRDLKIDQMAQGGLLTEDVLNAIERLQNREQLRTELTGPERMLKNSSSAARAIHISNQLRSMPAAKQADYLQSLADKEILTDAVMDELEKRMGAAAR
jgi:hypothetical protein